MSQPITDATTGAAARRKAAGPNAMPVDRARLATVIERALAEQPIVDMHTHLYPPSFGTTLAGAGTVPADPQGLLLWGMDELLTFHYLVAELFRAMPVGELSPQQFFALGKTQQAELVWQRLFRDHTPVSEACRGVLTMLQLLGLDTSDRKLSSYRAWFAQQDPSRHIDRVMELANIESITMTNNVFDDNESARWLADASVGNDPRFAPVLRFDALLEDMPTVRRKLTAWGYRVGAALDAATLDECRRFLRDWIARLRPIYCAVSQTPEFRYPAPPDNANLQITQTMLEKVVLPVCAEHGLPFAMMIGVRRLINPALQLAGDGVAATDVQSIANLCNTFPDNRFFVTLLARENQHELAVVARKFANLMPFGCWWFVNIPSLIEEITRMRLELLGTSFIPQHSDARVLEQVIYKWAHSRRIINRVLTDKYADLAATGWPVSDQDIRRDVRLLLRDNFRNFLRK